MRPIATTTKAGIIVTTRRTQSGICHRTNPCITTWPASVPTADEESPDESNAIANSDPAVAPRSGSSVACAPSSVSTSRAPLRWNVLAAMISIEALISIAIVIAINTSSLV